MLPNVCFPLFPVVDYKTFCRTYYDDDAVPHLPERRRAGCCAGVVQLMLYRLVYYYLTIDPCRGARARRPARATCCRHFLLYLRVSGQFHLIVGMLHLFGFNLPETHHRYLLASSFTDFWRRINIYWKDFMLKLFFYPAYFRLRKLGRRRRALVVATLYVVRRHLGAALRTSGSGCAARCSSCGRTCCSGPILGRCWS